MSATDDSLHRTESVGSQSRYARVQQALADATDENVRLWLAAAEHTAGNTALPAAGRIAAHDHAVACRDLLARRNGDPPNRANVAGVMADGS